MPEVELIIDGAALEEVLRGPDGPVARHMMDAATKVQLRSREILAPHKRTGCLADSIVKRPERIDGEFGMRVSSDTAPCSPTHTSYSLMVHEGTRPHVIEAKPGGVLAFEWHGQTVFRKRVNHPGTRPIPFLRDALPAALT